VNWTEARDATGERNTDGKYLTFRAPRSYRGSISFCDRNLSLSADYRWVAARPVLESNSKWLAPHDLLDVRAAWRFSYRKMTVEPAVGVNNAFAESYRIVRFAPMPLRQWYASLRISHL